MKCNLLHFTEFLNNIHLNKYACMVFQRFLKALHYSNFNLLITVTALYGDFWIWHILIEFSIKVSPFDIL